MTKVKTAKMYIHKYLLLFQDCSDQSGSQGQVATPRQNFTEKMFFACVP